MYLLVNECILPINVYIGEEKVRLRLFKAVFLVGNFSNKISPELSSALNKCDEMDQVHENIRSFKCEICGKCFVSNYQLTKHEILMHK